MRGEGVGKVGEARQEGKKGEKKGRKNFIIVGMKHQSFTQG